MFVQHDLVIDIVVLGRISLSAFSPQRIRRDSDVPKRFLILKIKKKKKNGVERKVEFVVVPEKTSL